MIGTITFYRMRGSLSSGEFPLFDSQEDLSQYAIATIERAKYRDGLQANADIPYFSGLKEANIASIGNSFYWVTAYTQKTSESNQYVVTLDYMGPTSLYRRNGTARGSWHKLPYNAAPYLKDAVTNGMMRITRSLSDIGNTQAIGWLGSGHLYFYQVTGYDANNAIHRICGFAFYSEEHGFYGNIRASSNTSYPSFADLIANITACTGLVANRVMDLSISVRCPYSFNYTVSGGFPTVTINDIGGNPIMPTVHGSNTFVTYDLEALQGTLEQYDKTETLTLTAMERALGNVNLIDWNGNIIATLPTQYGNTIDVIVETISDLSGLHTLIRCNDLKITVNEGKLPYLDNNYETYKAYQMNTDRESMENSIRFAEYDRDTQRITGTVNSAINGLASGVITGMAAGNPAASIVMGAAGSIVSGITNLYEQDRAMDLTRKKAEADMELSKRRTLEQPQTAYNAPYGMIYCALNERNPLQIAVSMPDNVDSTYYEQWTDNYGFPAEGIINANIQDGFYQGKLIDSVGGMLFDAANDTFMRGFRFVDPEGSGPEPTVTSLTINLTSEISGNLMLGVMSTGYYYEVWTPLTSSITLRGINPGTYTILDMGNNYVLTPETVIVSAGENVVNIEVTQEEPITAAQLVIELSADFTTNIDLSIAGPDGFTATRNISTNGYVVLSNLHIGTYSISASVSGYTYTFTPDSITVVAGENTLSSVVTRTSTLKHVKLGYYQGVGDGPNGVDMQWYGNLYNAIGNKIFDDDETTATYKLSNGTQLEFTGQGYDVNSFGCDYEPVSSLNPRQGLIAIEFNRGSQYTCIYNGKCYTRTGTSGSWSYVADVTEIVCSIATMTVIGTEQEQIMDLYTRGP